MIETRSGKAVLPLGLAAFPEQDPRCVRRAFAAGVNYFFFYSPSYTPFIEELVRLCGQHRDDLIVATGSGARKRNTLLAAKRKIFAALGTEMVDVFFAEYVHPGESFDAVLGDGGTLDLLQQWKSDGWVRYVGASTHDRSLARRLAADHRVDVLMHRTWRIARPSRRSSRPPKRPRRRSLPLLRRAGARCLKAETIGPAILPPPRIVTDIVFPMRPSNWRSVRHGELKNWRPTCGRSTRQA